MHSVRTRTSSVPALEPIAAEEPVDADAAAVDELDASELEQPMVWPRRGV